MLVFTCHNADNAQHLFGPRDVSGLFAYRQQLFCLIAGVGLFEKITQYSDFKIFII